MSTIAQEKRLALQRVDDVTKKALSTLTDHGRTSHAAIQAAATKATSVVTQQKKKSDDLIHATSDAANDAINRLADSLSGFNAPRSKKLKASGRKKSRRKSRRKSRCKGGRPRTDSHRESCCGR